LNGQLDIGVISCDDVPEDLETDHLFSSQMVAVVAPEHELAHREAITFDEVFEHELVMFQHGYFHREFLDHVSEEHGFSMKSSFETNLLPLILSIVRQEFAITALLELVTQNEKGVVGIPFHPPVTLDLALAWR
ncbi:LysR family transcriptional regulator substrate-binding protein, partial [Vibrio alginolyticus]